MTINKRKMKRINYLLFVFIMALAVSCGQKTSSTSGTESNQGQGNRTGGGRGNMNPEEFAKRQSEEMKEAIGLSDEQVKQVYDLTIENMAKMREMRQKMQQDGGGGFSEDMREQFQKMREESDARIMAVLTDDQKEKYKTWQEERRDRIRQQGGGGRN